MTYPAEPEEVVCPICQAVNSPERLLSTHAIGSPDLDLRPPPDEGTLLHYMIETCDNCFYTTIRLDHPPLAGTQAAMASTEWNELLKRNDLPSLAANFKRGEILRVFSQDYMGAVWMALRAVWVADDSRPSVAPALRREAALLVERAMAAGTPFASDFGGNEALLADLLRRSGDHKAAAYWANKGIQSAVNPVLKSVLAFQLKLIDIMDLKAHKIEEATTQQKSASQHQQPSMGEIVQEESTESRATLEIPTQKKSNEPAAYIRHQEADPTLIRVLRDIGLRALAHSGHKCPDVFMTSFLNNTVIVFSQTGCFMLGIGWRSLGVPEEIVSILLSIRYNLKAQGIDIFQPSMFLDVKDGPVIGPAERSLVFLKEFHIRLGCPPDDAPEWLRLTYSEIGKLIEPGSELVRAAGFTSELPKTAPDLSTQHSTSIVDSAPRPREDGDNESLAHADSLTYPIYRTEEPGFLSAHEYNGGFSDFLKHSEIRLWPYWTDTLIRKYLGNPDFLMNAEGTVLDLDNEDFAPSLTRLFNASRVEAAMQLSSWQADAHRVKAHREARDRSKNRRAFQKLICILCEREKAMKSFESGWKCKYCGYETKALD